MPFSVETIADEKKRQNKNSEPQKNSHIRTRLELYTHMTFQQQFFCASISQSIWDQFNETCNFLVVFLYLYTICSLLIESINDVMIF